MKDRPVAYQRLRDGLSPVYWAGASLKAAAHDASQPFGPELSPVYWAGASLKADLDAPCRHSRLLLSPVYWAGASLKAAGAALGSFGTSFFPRSTGPGPH